MGGHSRYGPGPHGGLFSFLLRGGAISLLAAGCGGGGGGGGSKAPLVALVATNDVGGAGSSFDVGEAIAIDASGRILVAGSTGSFFGSQDLAVWRYLDTGALDATFGTNGIVVHDNAGGGAGEDEGLGVVIDSGGRLLVCGFSEVSLGDPAMAIWAFNPDGSLDGTFGVSGIVIFDSNPVGSEDDVGRGIALDTFGQIVVVGEIEGGIFDQDMAVWRFDIDGLVDLGFGTGGVFIHANAAGGGGDDVGEDVAIDASGNIYVTGFSEGGFFDDDMVVWCVDGTGSLNPAFGGAGFIVHDGTAGGVEDDEGNGIAIDPFGFIVVAGWSMDANSVQKMMLWRFDPAGTLDTTFNGQGYVVHRPTMALNGILYDVAIDTLGRIVSPGAYLVNPASFEITLLAVRYEADGSLSLDARGPGIGPVNVPLAVAADSTGGAYMAGTSGDLFSNLDMALWRMPN